jgi:hypothetical protein
MGIELTTSPSILLLQGEDMPFELELIGGSIINSVPTNVRL